jgi:hypothetical protein
MPAALVMTVIVLTLTAVLVPAMGSPPAVAQGWEGLRGVSRVAVEIEIARDLADLPPDALEQRIEALLRETQPAPALDARSVDRLKLTVAVEPYNASDLRGFWLPFSGWYGIGPVRLVVIRPARVTGRQIPLPAVVWQAERLAKGSWGRSGREVLSIVDDLLGDLLDDYRRATSP